MMQSTVNLGRQSIVEPMLLVGHAEPKDICVDWFGCMQADVNVSLTAISLLWNAADLVGKGQAGKASGSSTAEPPSGDAGQEGSQSESLLRQLLAALQVTCLHLPAVHQISSAMFAFWQAVDSIL